MRIAILTFDGFNEIDSFVAFNILNRVQREGWSAQICGPSSALKSAFGVTVTAQQPLEFANEADAVVVGSGRQTRSIIEDSALMARLRLDPKRQLIASQCSGALVLGKLGLVGQQPICTDRYTRPYAEAAGLKVLEQPFSCVGNVASAGGCLAGYYLATWMIWRAAGKAAAQDALAYVVPVGQEKHYIEMAVNAVSPYM
jgi:transcriptional regulator GlxA family with amidase domain